MGRRCVSQGKPGKISFSEPKFKHLRYFVGLTRSTISGAGVKEPGGGFESLTASSQREAAGTRLFYWNLMILPSEGTPCRLRMNSR